MDGFGGGFNDYGNGGGFMGGGGFTSQDNQGSGSTRRTATTVLPVCINQIKEAQRGDDNALLISGREVDKVSLVAVVRQLELKTTRVLLNMEDSTGSMDGIKFLNTSADEEAEQGEGRTPPEFEQIREGRYVRVVGNIRPDENDKKKLTIFSISPVEDLNEVTFHIVQSIQAHLLSLFGIKGERKLGVKREQASQNVVGMNGAMNTSATMKADTSTLDMNSGLPAEQQAVLNVIVQQGRDSDTGVSVSTICDTLAGRNFSESKVRDILEELLGEGQVYSTIDDDHFKSTDE